jgi:hypothetical protein
MATQASSQALALTFKVLTPPLSTIELQRGQAPGIISLTGRALPYRPIIFSGKQRVKTTWYPGNPNATQQVMGPTEDPTTLNGMWKDRFLGDGQARALGVLFDNIRRSGSEIEMTWGAGVLGGIVFGPQITRRGLISNAEFTFDRPQDVAFKLTFDWSGRGEQVAPPIFAVGVENPREGLNQIISKLAVLTDTVSDFSRAAHTRVVGLSQTVEDTTAAVGNRIIDVTRAIDTATATGSTITNIPRTIVERGIDVSLQAVQVGRNLRAASEEIEALTYAVRDEALELLGFKTSQIAIAAASSDTEETASNVATGLTGQLFPEVIAEARPPIGTDLRDLAQEHYGDPDLWYIIAVYNGIVGSRVPDLPSGASDNPFATRPISIPRRIVGVLGDIRKGAGC